LIPVERRAEVVKLVFEYWQESLMMLVLLVLADAVYLKEVATGITVEAARA